RKPRQNPAVHHKAIQLHSPLRLKWTKPTQQGLPKRFCSNDRLPALLYRLKTLYFTGKFFNLFLKLFETTRIFPVKPINRMSQELDRFHTLVNIDQMLMHNSTCVRYRG